jgi:uncharacterized protein (DUF2126 family)
LAQDLFSSSQWQTIDQLGQQIDRVLQRQGVGLWMGGEPTYFSRSQSYLPEWNTTALGQDKWQVAQRLWQAMVNQFAAAGALLYHGTGKLYPGEDYPRWALGCYWRKDGVPLWTGTSGNALQPALTPTDVLPAFATQLLKNLHLEAKFAIPALDWTGEQLVAYVIPLLAIADAHTPHWASCHWRLANTGPDCDQDNPLLLLRGDAPPGLRLPLHKIPWALEPIAESTATLDAPSIRAGRFSGDNTIQVALVLSLTVEGHLSVFLPPLSSSRGFVDLLTAVEATAMALQLPVQIGGYSPPADPMITGFQLTPDPGVLEINIHPEESWLALVTQTVALDQLTQSLNLGSLKYRLDGRFCGTGGGAHITLGGRTCLESPLLRRPDLLRSFILYWQNHPSLSYLFTDSFIGPTSQAPRLDETHSERLYDLELAFQMLDQVPAIAPAELDQLLQPLLVDATGNAHRTALCIDKLYPSTNPRLQLGLLEFRAFGMPHHPQLRLLQLLLIRALVAWFWQDPYCTPLIAWGTALHDRFFLPHYLLADWDQVLQDLAQACYPFVPEWFTSWIELRLPRYGYIPLKTPAGEFVVLELRAALEPWPVLGDSSSGPSRPVDASMERLQVSLKTSATSAGRYQVLCQGQRIPLHPPQCSAASHILCEWIGGVRFRAKASPILNSTLGAPHAPLRFEVVDGESGKILGGCIYCATHPDGMDYDRAPWTAGEARSRLQQRVVPFAAASDTDRIAFPLPEVNVHPSYPLTLDLRWQELSRTTPTPSKIPIPH